MSCHINAVALFHPMNKIPSSREKIIFPYHFIASTSTPIYLLWHQKLFCRNFSCLWNGRTRSIIRKM